VVVRESRVVSTQLVGQEGREDSKYEREAEETERNHWQILQVEAKREFEFADRLEHFFIYLFFFLEKNQLQI
jgi:hypothetical protein